MTLEAVSGFLRVFGFTVSVDAMMTDMRILCAGEEGLMRVRYVSPLCGLTFQMDGIRTFGWFCCWFSFACFCLLVGLCCFVVGWLVFCVVFVFRSVPTHLCFHTEDVKLFRSLVKRALDLALETRCLWCVTQTFLF